ncbi:universal stress protein UspA-like protein [Salinarchaeum sp. Harcht-Bsk1]|uniref:universal stress protein n=1 Tax=Salinarchaeum sp. Harcht-Bsk1 TaxID=1333523 RepID=UPI000342284F|nr:universal stress protein [Salinarchaeum sp. Harcht-Bsk1]AGN01504.1 universal stress protein UspA-like protein [Salinarchaeum sp. Harcht-Bsk1]
MEPTIDTVLLATDGSDPAERAAEHAIALAATTEADLHVLAVADAAASRMAEATLGEQGGDSVLNEAAREATGAVADLAADAPASPDVTTIVRTGLAHKEIAAYAQEIDADVTVLGTEGRSGLDRVLLGSVAENVLRTSTRPVLLISPGTPAPDADQTPYDELLFPTDGSEGADRALDWAIGLAAHYAAPLHALFAADASPFPTTVRSKQLLQALESAGNDAIEAVRERGEARDVEVVGAVASGAPGPTILEYCEDEPIDLVVMGTHGRSGLDRYLLGSVTEHVVRHGDVPVFCVPMRGEE